MHVTSIRKVMNKYARLIQYRYHDLVTTAKTYVEVNIFEEFQCHVTTTL